MNKITTLLMLTATISLSACSKTEEAASTSEATIQAKWLTDCKDMGSSLAPFYVRIYVDLTETSGKFALLVDDDQDSECLGSYSMKDGDGNDISEPFTFGTELAFTEISGATDNGWKAFQNLDSISSTIKYGLFYLKDADTLYHNFNSVSSMPTDWAAWQSEYPDFTSDPVANGLELKRITALP